METFKSYVSLTRVYGLNGLSMKSQNKFMNMLIVD